MCVVKILRFFSESDYGKTCLASRFFFVYAWISLQRIFENKGVFVGIACCFFMRIPVIQMPIENRTRLSWQRKEKSGIGELKLCVRFQNRCAFVLFLRPSILMRFLPFFLHVPIDFWERKVKLIRSVLSVKARVVFCQIVLLCCCMKWKQRKNFHTICGKVFLLYREYSQKAYRRSGWRCIVFYKVW